MRLFFEFFWISRTLSCALVVIKIILIEKLPVAIGAGAGNQNRRSFPYAGILKLR